MDYKFLNKVVDNLLRESMYKFWETKEVDSTPYSHRNPKLQKIKVLIKFAMDNPDRSNPVETFDMDWVNRNRNRIKPLMIEDFEKSHLRDIYALNEEEINIVILDYYDTLNSNIYESYLEMDENNKILPFMPEKWFRGDEIYEIGKTNG